MTLLAGYDMVTEIGVGTLTTLFRNNLRLGDTELLTPFELDLPASLGAFSGRMRLVVRSLALDLRTGGPIVIELPFHYASLSSSDALICPLEGTITISVLPAIAAEWDAEREADIAQLVLDLGQAEVGLDFSAGSQAVIAEALAGTPLDPGMVPPLAERLMQDFIRSRGRAAFPLGLRLTPGSMGALSPDIVYAGLEAHCLGGDDRARQSFILGGFLYPGHIGRGRPAEKTSRVTPDLQVAVAMSPHVFRHLIFCPNAAAEFQRKKRANVLSLFPEGTPVDTSGIVVTAADLPTACGGAEAYEIEGVELTRMADTFEHGSIRLDLAFRKGGPCYNAEGTVQNRMRFAITPNGLQPSIESGEPEVDVDLSAWCWLAGWVVLRWVGIALVWIGEAVAQGIANGIAEDAIKKAFGRKMAATEFAAGTADINPRFTDVFVSPEGLLLVGRSNVTARPLPQGRIELVADWPTTNRREIETGTWTTRIFCEEREDTFPYTAFAQDQTLVIQVNTALAPILRMNFRIRVAQQEFELHGQAGTVVASGVRAWYPLPLGSGGAELVRDVEIAYVIEGGRLTLRNRAEDGNYGVDILMRYTDCGGNPIPPFSGLAYAGIHFEGQTVEVGNDYNARVQACFAATIRKLKSDPRLIHAKERPGDFKTPIPLGDPGPDDFRVIVEAVMNGALPAGEQALANLRATSQGGRMARALASPERVLKAAPIEAGAASPQCLADDLEAAARLLRADLARNSQT